MLVSGESVFFSSEKTVKGAEIHESGNNEDFVTMRKPLSLLTFSRFPHNIFLLYYYDR